jgi:signal transduction histidine kinase
MGLGLFLARTLVDSLDGEMTIESATGRGTTIRITLPQKS